MEIDSSLDEINKLTERIIGCAIEVHRQLGPGLLENTYESALCVEFESVGISFKRQVSYPVVYKGHSIGEYRVDLVVEGRVIVEWKSVERLDPVFEAQVLTYLKITGTKVGLLINFNTRMLTNGIKRLIL
ncbi:MAG: GxxExxY protein [Bacteroidetes bacterium]|nr:GxxExxY protein [Bacteroidota bacterium]MCW5895603.1 GxxExxY protein [Bacteroidota bacterium]